MMLKKLQKLIKRHPFLYLSRFRLVSKNSSVDAIQSLNYNDLNPKGGIPDYFYEINALIFKDIRPTSDFETVKHISLWLKAHIKGGRGLSEPSDKALHTMLSGAGGVCSDMAQIFNNFCVINDLKVREWGTTSAPFNRAFGGHSFNEVFCKELEKWMLIDVYWCFYFKSDNGNPLSVIELYQRNRCDKPIHCQSFYPTMTVEPMTVAKNYLNPDIIPFLICGYRNSIYDAFLKRTQSFVPIFVTHFVIFLLGSSYHYQFPLDDYKAIFS